ncbi:carbohydrate kinase family protein [Staphylococcus auricularis]|uniref:Carbohydrate kinase n=1 Tax=Staphylococcus auricularis TaxID=29379 RepID=A0AAW7M5G9_9STAP|nr:carbohydrate kinase [Staphylococcus auricularis]MDC6328011.1 carbohydrate kinase [Staphylococcus auricularis]MDN4532137.1 carbohydrate kinase [Staphylococcus auricularis]
MRRLFAIGEALIDFIPNETDIKLKDVQGFTRRVGGAPCNVAATTRKLGGEAALVTQLGEDAFGDLIVETLQSIGVNTQYIERTEEANTALAFVSLTADGERDFSFYRKPSADMLYDPSQINEIKLTEEDILHFCSVDLVESKMKAAHEEIIDQMHQVGGTIVFDPNVRLPLWEDEDACRKTIQQFIPKAHVVKISDEELNFVTGIEDEAQAIQWLFQGHVEAVIFTKGAAGATIYLKDGTTLSHQGFQVTPVDTTGAGDAFIGAVISRLLATETHDVIEILKSQGEQILKFSNFVAAKVTTQHGAIESIPTLEEVNQALDQ